MVKRACVLLMSIWVLCACQPADNNVKTVRERVLSGEIVRFSEDGFSLCGARAKAWTDMRARHMDERRRIVLSQQESKLDGGVSCYRVGSVISVNVNNRQLNEGGSVRVMRVGLARADRVRTSDLRGEYFSAQANLDGYKNDLRINPKDEGIVTLVDFSYVKGSATDEAQLRQLEAESLLTDGLVETAKDGERLPGSGCTDRTYSYVRVPEDLKDDFLSGRFKSWYELRDDTCLIQGQEVDLSVGEKKPVLARAKIKKIKKLRVKFAEAKHFDLGANADFSKIGPRIQRDNSKNSTWMIVIDFEVLGSEVKP